MEKNHDTNISQRVIVLAVSFAYNYTTDINNKVISPIRFF